MISIGLTAGATLYSGYQQQQQANYQARVSEVNATYAERQTRDALDRGQRAEFEHYVKLARMKGEQTAAMAANGVDLSFGSPLDVATDTAQLGHYDADTIAMNAAREADGYTINASNYRAEAAGQRAAGRGAMIGAALSAGGTILGGASQVSGLEAKYGKPAWMGGPKGVASWPTRSKVQVYGG